MARLRHLRPDTPKPTPLEIRRRKNDDEIAQGIARVPRNPIGMLLMASKTGKDDAGIRKKNARTCLLLSFREGGDQQANPQAPPAGKYGSGGQHQQAAARNRNQKVRRRDQARQTGNQKEWDGLPRMNPPAGWASP